MTHSITAGTNGIYNVEYRIANIKDGSLKIVHAQEKAVFDTNNKVYKVTGTAQDVPMNGI